MTKEDVEAIKIIAIFSCVGIWGSVLFLSVAAVQITEIIWK